MGSLKTEEKKTETVSSGTVSSDDRCTEQDIREDILEATVRLFNRKGMKFTMDDLAAELHRSKKTIYVYFPDKKHLLYDMVDYIFDSIKEDEQKVYENRKMDIVERIRRILGVMPDRYQNVDFRQLYNLREKYPAVYRHLKERLESGWESTVELLKEGMRQGKIRRFSIPVFQTMMEATLEQFFQRDILFESGLTYHAALQEVVDILVKGIVICDP
ncbi:MAG: TetR/AcrR family transcriptional regulator [Bilifractor sp.]|jgi:AcrR family transcriptional regulator